MPFNWHVYLSETGAEVTPPSLFAHVTQSLRTLVQKGETLEVRHDASEHQINPLVESQEKWWPAEVVLVSGFLILLKWSKPTASDAPLEQDPFLTTEAHEEENPARSTASYLWFNTKGSNWNIIRPSGWCMSKNITWTPPKHLLDDRCDASYLVTDEWKLSICKRSVSRTFFDYHYLYHYETIRIGGYFDCEHECDPRCVWPAKVLGNFGGRVRLSWFGLDSKKIKEPASFSIFYLNRRVHPLGWGKLYGLKYQPPPGFTVDRAITNIDAFLRGALPASSLMFECGLDVNKMTYIHPNEHNPPLHDFKVGWKLEAVNPKQPFLLQPATVVKIFDARYFLVEFDTVRNVHDDSSVSIEPITETIQFVSFAGSAEIMPVSTSQLKGIQLAAPPGWSSKRPFTWTNYLTSVSAAKSHAFSLKNDTTKTEAFTTNGPKCAAVIDTLSIVTTAIGSIIDTSDNIPKEAFDLSPDPTPYCPPESAFRGNYISSLYPGCGPAGDNRRSSSIVTNNANAHWISSVESGQLNMTTTTERNAPQFLLGMKLEMVIPNYNLDSQFGSPELGPFLCTATVTRVDNVNLLWLLPDLPAEYMNVKPIMVDARSTDLYPVGWAASVGHPFVPPPYYDNCVVDTMTGISSLPSIPTKSTDSAASESTPKQTVSIARPLSDLQYCIAQFQDEEECPPVYVNTKCYLGPFLCKANLETLPHRFGPGPITRVMQSLITRLVGAAYKPIRVLRMFEADWVTGLGSAVNTLRTAKRTAAGVANGSGQVLRGRHQSIPAAQAMLHLAECEMVEQRRTGMRVVLVQTSCPRRGTKVEAPVEVCCRVRALEEFCRQLSLVLEACPYLISTRSMNSVPASKEICSAATNPLAFGKRSMSCTNLALSNLPTMLRCGCPSFCLIRLRSRTFDRLSGLRRRGYQPTFNGDFHNNVHPNSTGLRTRSAVAAYQQHFANRNSASLTSDPERSTLNTAIRSLTHNSGIPISRTTRRLSGRSAGRCRGGSRSRNLSGNHLPRHGSSELCNHDLESGNSTSTQPRPGRKRRGVSEESFPANDQSFNTDIIQSNPVQHSYSPTYPHLHFTWRNQLHSIPQGTQRSQAANRLNVNRSTTYGQLVCLPTGGWTSGENHSNDFLIDIPHVTLHSNPMHWTPVELAAYIESTDCRDMWPWLAAEAVDGQAFMLLTLPVLLRSVGLRWEDALRLDRHVQSLKRAFVQHFSA